MSASDREGVIEKHVRKVFDTLAWKDPEDGDFGALVVTPNWFLVYSCIAISTLRQKESLPHYGGAEYGPVKPSKSISHLLPPPPTTSRTAQRSGIRGLQNISISKNSTIHSPYATNPSARYEIIQAKCKHSTAACISSE
jgi:hypothetical protein